MAISSTNPATGELLQSFTPLSDREIDDKITRAREAFFEHRQTSFADRSRKMLRAAEILDEEKDAIARLMTLEMGKTYRSALDEVAKCSWVCRYYAENAERFMADERVETSARESYVRYEPLGPILVIMPWNYPFWQVFRFIAPGLMAGNVGLLKHASNVPQCALMIEDVLRRAGFPEGVFQTLLIGSPQVDRIFADPRVMAATLTGSEQAGVQVGVSAAQRIKKVVLELGGTDPFIVMPSADLEAASSVAVKARVGNNGQSCIAAKRFIVARPVADKFEALFVRKMEALKVGDPMDSATDVGPLATAEAVRSLHADVQKSVAAGARVLTGGKLIERKGFYYPPTVLTNIDKASPAGCEELFGPVASLFRVADAREAIELANDSRFGLGASVWTNDQNERQQFIRQLESGMVFINSLVFSDPRVPFGGVKRSGYGRELGGIHGIREFTNIKTVWIAE